MTQQDIDRLKALEQQATKGPWELHSVYDHTGYPAYYLHGFCGDEKRSHVAHEINPEFIAALRNAAPDLIAAAEKWQQVVAMRQSIQHVVDCDNARDCSVGNEMCLELLRLIDGSGRERRG